MFDSKSMAYKFSTDCEVHLTQAPNNNCGIHNGILVIEQQNLKHHMTVDFIGSYDTLCKMDLSEIANQLLGIINSQLPKDSRVEKVALGNITAEN